MHRYENKQYDSKMNENIAFFCVGTKMVVEWSYNSMEIKHTEINQSLALSSCLEIDVDAIWNANAFDLEHFH